ncbi:MAG: hypothetical protein ABEJ95_01645 [Candidatus Nanohalobium sp.]
MKWVLITGAAAITVALITGYLQGPDFKFQGNQAIIALSFLLVNTLFYIPVKWVLNWISTVEYEYIAEIDATDAEPIQIYATLKGKMKKEVEMTQGQLYTFQTDGGHILHIVREIDWEEKEAKGVWLGEVTDLELLKNLNNIEAQRFRNRKFTKAFLQLLGKFSAKAEDIEAEYFSKLDLRKIEYSQIDSTSITEEIQEILEEIDLETLEE